jgi:hypothetical protein
VRSQHGDAIAPGRATASGTSRNNWNGKDKRGRGNGQDYRPFIVIVHLWNRRNEYGKYSTCAEADAEVAKLKKLEFHAERVAR